MGIFGAISGAVAGLNSGSSNNNSGGLGGLSGLVSRFGANRAISGNSNNNSGGLSGLVSGFGATHATSGNLNNNNGGLSANPIAPSPSQDGYSDGIQELSGRVEALESSQSSGMPGVGSIANESQPVNTIQNTPQVNTPFAPSNEMGFAKPNFSPLVQQNANDIFGSGPERDRTMIR